MISDKREEGGGGDFVGFNQGLGYCKVIGCHFGAGWNAEGMVNSASEFSKNE